MLYLKDKQNEVWSSLSPDMTAIHYEDGTIEPLTTKNLRITTGKYKGQDLSDVSDISYLSWMKRASSEDGNEFVAMMIGRRLKELGV